VRVGDALPTEVPVTVAAFAPTAFSVPLDVPATPGPQLLIAELQSLSGDRIAAQRLDVVVQ